MSSGKIYFASDFHLGIDTQWSSLDRERKIVRWLDQIKVDAAEIYLVGDLFDFWFEYNSVVPKGYVRLLGKLAELRDSGIEISIFTGNHDMWMYDYFPSEFDIPVFKDPIVKSWMGKIFYIGHGDGLGPGDHGYKLIKKVFRNRLSQWLFARLHPNFGIGLANYWSGKSRSANRETHDFLGVDREWLYQFADTYKDQEIDYFIFGHRHLPIHITLSDKSKSYINLGDWMRHFSYGVFDGTAMELRFFENDQGIIYPKD